MAAPPPPGSDDTASRSVEHASSAVTSLRIVFATTSGGAHLPAGAHDTYLTLVRFFCLRVIARSQWIHAPKSICMQETTFLSLSYLLTKFVFSCGFHVNLSTQHAITVQPNKFAACHPIMPVPTFISALMHPCTHINRCSTSDHAKCQRWQK